MRVVDLCRQNGISDATFYKWCAKYGGMDVSDAKHPRQLEDVRRAAFARPTGRSSQGALPLIRSFAGIPESVPDPAASLPQTFLKQGLRVRFRLFSRRGIRRFGS